MKKVKIYSKSFCPYCVRAKNLLANKNIPFEEINLENDPDFYEQLKARTGMKTVPQIFIDETLIGGFTDLDALNQSGELDRMVRSETDNPSAETF